MAMPERKDNSDDNVQWTDAGRALLKAMLEDEEFLKGSLLGFQELREGKTISLDELKRRLGDI